ncbi:hypothetical protein NX779_01615 [Mycoplasma cottewii]|uniref:Uncharacterized protein n=1 Tax=Mycoplasma cottewii TaxID=51364 RepID=A0ABY5U0I7_9MOLU|nr:hypothetical protein [Mycoplasma cottewii]UWD35316.1 hypothetical protein NX779_01615 [Mycoplasma cottewii]
MRLGVNTHAGSFDELDKDKIIEAFVNINSSKLPGINKDNLVIVGDVVGNSLRIRVERSDKFQGEITINFIIRTQINRIGANTETGAFNSANTNEIIDAFIRNNQDKLPGLTRDNFEVVGNISNNSIVVKVINSSNFQGTISLNFSVRTQINTIQANRFAGSFNTVDVDAIINAFIDKNKDKLPGLTRDNFEVIGDPTNNSIIVEVKDNDKFQGQITINFNVKEFISNDGVNVNAGAFNRKDVEDIISRFISNNKDKLPGLTRSDLRIVGQSDNSITIEVRKENLIYQGQVTINYSIRTDINSIGVNTNMGAFNSSNTEVIIEAFIKDNKEKLDGLTISNFVIVGNVSNNSMTIRVINSDKFKVKLELTLQLKLMFQLTLIKM